MVLPTPSKYPDSESDVSVSSPAEHDLLKDTSYSHSTQKLNEIITRLRECGTEQVLSLPKIAVVGNQSAGKSSLLEAISQIKVPRAAVTCTRCPMEIILRRGSGNASDWHCRISLRREYNEAGEKIGVPEIIPFAETSDKEKVTDLLRGAQMAILNPSVDPKAFHPGEPFDSEKAVEPQQFSKNVVTLEISGATVDVTIIDLPGIISNTEKACYDSHRLRAINLLCRMKMKVSLVWWTILSKNM